MAKYINADIFLAKVGRHLKSSNFLPAYEDGINDAVSDIMTMIEKEPAADVRPERHAHWEHIPLKSKYEMVKCSICGWGHGTVAASDMIFCDHCGAKMDGMDGDSNG